MTQLRMPELAREGESREAGSLPRARGMQTLLAVDLGVRTGLALYGGDGRLVRYRSQNYGSAARLRRAIPALLAEAPAPTIVVVEGGGPLLDAWARATARRGIALRPVSAETW